MFDVLTTLVTQALSKIAESSIDLLSKKATSKRPLAVALIQLYDATVQLQAASQAAYDAFRRFRDAETIPLRITVKEKLDDLFEAVGNFGKCARAVYPYLGIYDQGLALTLVDGVFYGKLRTLATIDFLLEVVPTHVKNGKYLTDKISIATSLPEAADLGVKRVDASPLFPADPERRTAEIRERVLSKLNKREIDFTDRINLELVLRDAERNLEEIRRARAELAVFIKRSVPFAEILAE